MLVVTFLVAFTLAIFPSDARKRRAEEPEVKYVFYFIADGMGINCVQGTELYNQATGKGPGTVNFLHFPVRTMLTTYSASSLVTDSAAAGTTLASGHKTNAAYLGVDAGGKTVYCLSDWAKAKGMGVGVATSVGINHATPAAFYAHVDSRYDFARIIDDYISSPVDFLAGPGMYADKKAKATALDLENRIAASGITVLKKDAVKGAADVKGRVLCMDETDSKELKFAIDQEEGDMNLSDFVEAGIDYLDGHYGDKGFFFMVEGGKIDYANHSNDAVGAFHEVNDFAAAIGLALEFYDEHPKETIIVVTSDHETGGMLLGAGKYKMNPERLAWQNASENALSAEYRALFADQPLTFEPVKAFLTEKLGLWSHVEAEKEFEEQLKATVERLAKDGEDPEVEDLYSTNVRIVYDAVKYLARKSGFSWSVSSHSGSPLGLYVFGTGAEAFVGCHDQVDVPLKIAEVAGYKVF